MNDLTAELAAETPLMFLEGHRPVWRCQQCYAAAYGGPELIAHRANCAHLRALRAVPLDMVLHCPDCGLQHIDAPDNNPCADGCRYGKDVGMGGDACGGPCMYMDPASPRWTNPPHRTHLCHGCGHKWRPADVYTNGVQSTKTHGQDDSRRPLHTLSAANQKWTRHHLVGYPDLVVAILNRRGAAVVPTEQQIMDACRAHAERGRWPSSWIEAAYDVLKLVGVSK